MQDKYPVGELKLLDEEVDDPREKERYTYVQNGDNFLCPFQCDLCHFRNLKHRDPKRESYQDIDMLVAIRRANLDAFWGRSEGTVGNTRRDLKKMLDISMGVYGLNSLLPDMGPHPLRDDWGMGLAIVLLHRTLDKGNNTENIQYQTARKFRSAYSNLWGASKYTLTQGVLAWDTMKLFVTDCPSFSLWFEQFCKGVHSRMGDDRQPDAAISNKVMHKMMERVEWDLLETKDQRLKRFITRAGLFYMSAYLGALRGEEVPRVVTKYFISLNKEALKSTPSHCVLPLYGRFKSEQGVPRCYVF